MQTILVLLLLAGLVSACQPSCPARLVEEEEYEGEGFIVTHEPANSFLVFYPACTINSQHYLASLTGHNLGQGITFGLGNLQYASAILMANGRFKLHKYPVDRYSYQGLYIVPARIKYHDLQHDNPIRIYPANHTLDRASITTPYASAFVQLDTLIVLPYSP